MKLTIRSIITAEKLLKKAFLRFQSGSFSNLWELKSERAKMMKFITLKWSM